MLMDAEGSEVPVKVLVDPAVPSRCKSGGSGFMVQKPGTYVCRIQSIEDLTSAHFRLDACQLVLQQLGVLHAWAAGGQDHLPSTVQPRSSFVTDLVKCSHFTIVRTSWASLVVFQNQLLVFTGCNGLSVPAQG